MLTGKTLIRGKPLKFNFFLEDLFLKKHFYPFRCTSHVSFSEAEDYFLDPDRFLLYRVDGDYYLDIFH